MVNMVNVFRPQPYACVCARACTRTHMQNPLARVWGMKNIHHIHLGGCRLRVSNCSPVTYNMVNVRVNVG